MIFRKNNILTSFRTNCFAFSQLTMHDGHYGMQAIQTNQTISNSNFRDILNACRRLQCCFDETTTVIATVATVGRAVAITLRPNCRIAYSFNTTILITFHSGYILCIPMTAWPRSYRFKNPFTVNYSCAYHRHTCNFILVNEINITTRKNRYL